MCCSTKQRSAHPTVPISKELTDPGTSETDGSQRSSGGGQLVLNDSVHSQRTSLLSMQKQKTVHDDTKSAAGMQRFVSTFTQFKQPLSHSKKVFRQLVVSGEFQKNSQEEVIGAKHALSP